MLSTAAQSAMLSAANSPSSPLSGVSSHMSDAQMNKVSKDFESMFVSQMVDQMFGDSEGDEMFGSSETSDVYKGMMVDQLGKQIADSGGIGIAGYVKQALLKLQEV